MTNIIIVSSICHNCLYTQLIVERTETEKKLKTADKTNKLATNNRQKQATKTPYHLD